MGSSTITASFICPSLNSGHNRSSLKNFRSKRQALPENLPSRTGSSLQAISRKFSISSTDNTQIPPPPIPKETILQNAETQIPCQRRALLLSLSALGASHLHTLLLGTPALAAPVAPAKIDLSTQPTVAFDATDETLRRVAEIFQSGLSAESVEKEENQWSEVIRIAESAPPGTPWVNDILSRAYGNRGNARSRQGRLEEAIGDYNKAIELAPYAADPVLNRGVALESLRRFDEAAADYRAVLDVDARDPAAWNNLGNIMAATGNWEEAAADYKKAAEIAPEFSFAAANLALATYQLGNDNLAMRQMRTLLRRYPEFPDMRAALAVSLYSAGLIGDAESNWLRLEDLRYKDVTWVKDVRRWPPRLVTELQRFLKIAPA